MNPYSDLPFGYEDSLETTHGRYGTCTTVLVRSWYDGRLTLVSARWVLEFRGQA